MAGAKEEEQVAVLSLQQLRSLITSAPRQDSADLRPPDLPLPSLANNEPDSWVQFRRSFNVVADLNGWSMPERARQVLGGLSTEAFVSLVNQGFDAHGTNPHTGLPWTAQQIIETAELACLPPHVNVLALDDFRHAYQLSTENVAGWRSRLTDLFLAAYPGEEVETNRGLIRRFVLGLRNEYARFRLQDDFPSRLTDCFDQVTKLAEAAGDAMVVFDVNIDNCWEWQPADLPSLEEATAMMAALAAPVPPEASGQHGQPSSASAGATAGAPPSGVAVPLPVMPEEGSVLPVTELIDPADGAASIFPTGQLLPGATTQIRPRESVATTNAASSSTESSPPTAAPTNPAPPPPLPGPAVQADATTTDGAAPTIAPGAPDGDQSLMPPPSAPSTTTTTSATAPTTSSSPRPQAAIAPADFGPGRPSPAMANTHLVQSMSLVHGGRCLQIQIRLFPENPASPALLELAPWFGDMEDKVRQLPEVRYNQEELDDMEKNVRTLYMEFAELYGKLGYTQTTPSGLEFYFYHDLNAGGAPKNALATFRRRWALLELAFSSRLHNIRAVREHVLIYQSDFDKVTKGMRFVRRALKKVGSLDRDDLLVALQCVRQVDAYYKALHHTRDRLQQAARLLQPNLGPPTVVLRDYPLEINRLRERILLHLGPDESLRREAVPSPPPPPPPSPRKQRHQPQRGRRTRSSTATTHDATPAKRSMGTITITPCPPSPSGAPSTPSSSASGSTTTTPAPLSPLSPSDPAFQADLQT